MRVGFVGVGAIGGTLAALLDRAGHDVHVAARGATLDAVRSRGLVLTGAFGEHTAHPAADSTLAGAALAGPLDLVVFATKAMDGPAAYAANAAACAGAPVVVIQNGLDAIRGSGDVLARSRLLGGLSVWASQQVEPGIIQATAGGRLVIGPTSADDPVASLLGDAVPTSTTEDFVGAQWSKLVVNQVNALPAITGLSVQETIADDRLRAVLTASIRETISVARGAGVHFGRFQGLSHGLLTLVRLAPFRVAEQLPRRIARRWGDVPNYGSTLQSIRHGLPTEIDYLNGAVVAAAREAGVDAPINQSLTALVHEVERTGVFLSPEQLQARILRT